MIIATDFIDRAIPLTPRGYRVTTHKRGHYTIFPKATHQYFPTLPEAEDWVRRKLEKATTPPTWVSESLIVTQPYSDVPTLDTDGVNLWINGTLVVSNPTSGRDAWQQMREFPLANYLKANPCTYCGGIPRIYLHGGRLEHIVKGCRMNIRTVADPLTPLPLQIAVWNRRLYKRGRETSLLPMTRLHFIILGALREPNEQDYVRKMRKIDTFQL